MVNRESGSSVDGVPHHLRQSWDIGAISQALNHSPEPTHDIAHGPGIRYALADGALTVELFPPHAERSKGIVRLSTADSLQEFYRQPQPAIREEGLVFETHNHLISLFPTGELMTYRLVLEEGDVELLDASEDDKGSDTRRDDDQGTGGDSAASGRPFQNALPETGEQPRVTYSGRLGTDPRTKVTPKGKFVMEFPVAVAVADQEKPEWRQTVVFDAKARALDGVLHKGMAVEGIAYEHHKTKTEPATGRRREVREYYTTTVTPKPRDGEPASEALHRPLSSSSR